MSDKDPSMQNAPVAPPPRHSRPASTQNIQGSQGIGSPTERPKQADSSRSRDVTSAESSRSQSSQARSPVSSGGNSAASTRSGQPGSPRNPSGNSPSSLRSPHSGSSRGRRRNTLGIFEPSIGSRSSGTSASSGGSSQQPTSSRSRSRGKSSQQASSSRSPKGYRSRGESPQQGSNSRPAEDFRFPGESSQQAFGSQSPEGSRSREGESSQEASSARSRGGSSAESSNEQVLRSKSQEQMSPKLEGESSSTRSRHISTGESSSTIMRTNPRSHGQSSHETPRETLSDDESERSSKSRKRGHRRKRPKKRNDGHRSEKSNPVAESPVSSSSPSNTSIGPSDWATDNSSLDGQQQLPPPPPNVKQQNAPSDRTSKPLASSDSHQQPPQQQTASSYRASQPSASLSILQQEPIHQIAPSHQASPIFASSSSQQQQPQQQAASPYWASAIFVPSGSQQQQLQRQAPPSQGSEISTSSSSQQQQAQQQTLEGGKGEGEHRSGSHRRHRRKHRRDNKYDFGSYGSQQDIGSRKSPFGMPSKEADEDGWKDGQSQQTTFGPQETSSGIVHDIETKNKFGNLDEYMKFGRRQSVLAQNPQIANLIIGLPPPKLDKYGRKRIHQKQDSSSDARTDAPSMDSIYGDVFAKPINNSLFEADPSSSTSLVPRRASIIATMVQKKNVREGSKAFRHLDFRGLDKNISNVTGDPIFDPSLRLLVNNNLFENEAPDPFKKSGSVFVALPIPSSGVVSNPREALAQAGWVKSHPNDPVERASGISPIRSDDKLQRALGSGFSPSSIQAVDFNSAAGMMESDFNSASVENPGMFGSTLPQPPVTDGVNQMPEIWSQGLEFDHAIAWQHQSFSVPFDGSPPPCQDNQLQPDFSPDQEFGFQANQQFGDGTRKVLESNMQAVCKIRGSIVQDLQMLFWRVTSEL